MKCILLTLSCIIHFLFLWEVEGTTNKRGVQVNDRSSDYSRLVPPMLHFGNRNKDHKKPIHELSLSEIQYLKTLILRALGLEKPPKADGTLVPVEEHLKVISEFNGLVSHHPANRKDVDNVLDEVTLLNINGKTSDTNDRIRSELGKEDQVIWMQIPENLTETFGGILKVQANIWKVGPKKYPNIKDEFIDICFAWIWDRLGEHNYVHQRDLGCKNISVYDSEQVVINITKYIRRWANNPHSNTGILIRCPRCEAYAVRFPLQPGDYNGRKMTQFSFQLQTLKNPGASVKPKIIETPLCDDHKAMGSRPSRWDKCCRRSMKIKMDDIKGFDFILSPREFDAYYCSGECLPRFNSSKNHCVLQAFVHLENQTVIPTPCCSPQEYRGIRVLHFNEEGRMKISILPNAIVTRCSCT